MSATTTALWIKAQWNVSRRLATRFPSCWSLLKTTMEITYSTTGTVKDDKGNLLKGVKIKLLKPGGTVVKTTTTNENGFYEFLRDEPCGLPAHNYSTMSHETEVVY